MAQQRNSGIDLLRMVSMFMVVVLHVLGQGGILAALLPRYGTAVLVLSRPLPSPPPPRLTGSGGKGTAAFCRSQVSIRKK